MPIAVQKWIKKRSCLLDNEHTSLTTIKLDLPSMYFCSSSYAATFDSTAFRNTLVIVLTMAKENKLRKGPRTLAKGWTHASVSDRRTEDDSDVVDATTEATVLKSALLDDAAEIMSAAMESIILSSVDREMNLFEVVVASDPAVGGAKAETVLTDADAAAAANARKYLQFVMLHF